MTSGRLSEMFGAGQVDNDAFLRTLGWDRIAKQEYEEKLSPATKKYLQAYAKGVNAYLEGKEGKDISLEYAALSFENDYKPGAWTPVDSVAWLKAMAWDLRGNMQDEIDRALLTSRLGPKQIADLYPSYPYDRNKPVVQEGGYDENSGTFEAEGGSGDGEGDGDGTGSGEGTGSGDGAGSELGGGTGAGAEGDAARLREPAHRAPAGAGGPPHRRRRQRRRHRLQLLGRLRRAHRLRQAAARQRPAPVGLAAVRLVPDGPALPQRLRQLPLRRHGVHLRGHARVIIGHNQDIAWGLTNSGVDVTDLYLEKITGDGYQYGDKVVPFKTREETIKVAGGASRKIVIRETDNGPLLSDRSDDLVKTGKKAAVDSAAPDRGDGYAVALRWTALDPGRTMDAVFAINRAKDWDDFREASELFEVPSQNLVYADTDGHIGYTLPGKIPTRAEKHDGSVPAPGWDPDYEWTGWVDQDELPYEFDPERGYIVTANQAVVDEDYPYTLTTDWGTAPAASGSTT